MTAARDGRRVLLAVVLAATLAACRPEPLPVFGTVPPFSLTDRTGRTVSQADLAGQVWVANFIFTRCPDVCPALTQRMALLQEALTGPPTPIRLVSFSVDPDHDTPQVLQGYAMRMGAREFWYFLTGPRDTVATLVKHGFKLAFGDDGPADAPITHSDRFVLVDRELRIRGYYRGGDPDDLTRLERDAGALRDGRRS
jgi:protein SCO1/2